MLRCAALPAVRCSVASNSNCSRTKAADDCHRRVAHRPFVSNRVSAAVSFSSHGLTISTASLPSSTTADVSNIVTHAVAGGEHVLGSSGAGSAATASSELLAASSPSVQPSVAARWASGCQHVLQPAAAAAHMAAEAADTGWRQLLHCLTARRSTFVTAVSVALGGALLLFLTLRLWRQLRKGPRHRAQAAQRDAAAAQLARQRQRIMLALDEYVEDAPAAATMHTFEAIFQDYQSLLDTSVPTLDADGLPLGEAMINPLYNDADSQEVQQQWAEFVAGAKVTEVSSEAWWDIRDTEEQPGVVADDIDWNA